MKDDDACRMAFRVKGWVCSTMADWREGHGVQPADSEADETGGRGRGGGDVTTVGCERIEVGGKDDFHNGSRNVESNGVHYE
jgi:hypothetical protein